MTTLSRLAFVLVVTFLASRPVQAADEQLQDADAAAVSKAVADWMYSGDVERRKPVDAFWRDVDVKRIHELNPKSAWIGFWYADRYWRFLYDFATKSVSPEPRADWEFMRESGISPSWAFVTVVVYLRATGDEDHLGVRVDTGNFCVGRASWAILTVQDGAWRLAEGKHSSIKCCW